LIFFGCEGRALNRHCAGELELAGTCGERSDPAVVEFRRSIDGTLANLWIG
jgi:hypothetical protein